MLALKKVIVMRAFIDITRRILVRIYSGLSMFLGGNMQRQWQRRYWERRFRQQQQQQERLLGGRTVIGHWITPTHQTYLLRRLKEEAAIRSRGSCDLSRLQSDD